MVGQTVVVQEEELVGEYGLDAPRVVRAVGYLAGGLLALAVFFAVVGIVPLMVLAFLASSFVAFLALALVRSSRVGKVRGRIALVDRLGLGGDEMVLDVGCGPGVLLIEAAHRLPDGLAVGIDVWREQDVSDNDPHTTQDNAELEGVDDLIEVQVADARRMPFSDDSFDAVVSRLALHNIDQADGRVQAIREIHRVLKPGGKLLIVDIMRTTDFVHALRACNWTAVSRSKLSWRVVPPVRSIEGTKPEPGAVAATAAEAVTKIEETDAEPEEPTAADADEPGDAAEDADESGDAAEDSDEPDAPEEKPEVPVV